MRTISFCITLLTIACFCLPACNPIGEFVRGDGNVVTKSRNTGSFEKISLESSVNVYLTQGPAEDIRIEAESNIQPYIETPVQDGRLLIKFRNNTSIQTTKSVNVYITTPYIRAISVTGSGDMEAKNEITNTQAIDLNMTGSGDIRIRLNTPRVKAQITGSGDINISGEIRDLDVSILGSGSFKGQGLKSENAKVKIAGSGNASFYASEKLNADILGSGNIYYRGSPAVELHKMGSGNVEKQD